MDPILRGRCGSKQDTGFEVAGFKGNNSEVST